MTLTYALNILTAHAEWAAGVNAVEHYETAAEAFWRDTGIMAPGKSRPMDWPDVTDEDRRVWNEWLKARAAERLEAVRLIAAHINAKEVAR